MICNICGAGAISENEYGEIYVAPDTHADWCPDKEAS